MIEVGEYIKTNTGIIDKVIKYDEILEEYWLEKGQVIDINNKVGIYIKDITKHSKNIIDLIEVGDIVNGERILDITGEYIHTNETDHNRFYLSTHIKSILTHEQFEKNSYKVEK